MVSPFGPPGLAYAAWRERRYEVATCREQLPEVRQVSRYAKFRKVFKPELIGTMMNILQESRVVHPPPRRQQADDPDSFLLDLAEASGADYLVTGGKRAGLLQRRRVGRAAIVTAADFCSKVLRCIEFPAALTAVPSPAVAPDKPRSSKSPARAQPASAPPSRPGLPNAAARQLSPSSWNSPPQPRPPKPSPPLAT
jgi:putative PIN family toxin of toxin-antitoxin system